jgi:S-adenosylmethionine:tRNA ribosyltransferase-isomerase
MHQERIAVPAATLGRLIEHARRRRDSGDAPFVMVGTTSVRTLESLYWFGVRVIAGEAEGEELMVEQWDPYRLAAERNDLPDLVASLEAVERWRTSHNLDVVTGRTGIIIVPGYTFRACDALITNFHQPGSTLILLVAALLGRNLWKRVYDEALAQGYRFLSYGDASLLRYKV